MPNIYYNIQNVYTSDIEPVLSTDLWLNFRVPAWFGVKATANDKNDALNKIKINQSWGLIPQSTNENINISSKETGDFYATIPVKNKVSQGQSAAINGVKSKRHKRHKITKRHKRHKITKRKT